MTAMKSDRPCFLKELNKHLILIDSVSKRYSATGLRVGVMASRNRELLQTALKFCQARLCPPNLGQLAAEAALDSPPEYRRLYLQFIS